MRSWAAWIDWKCSSERWTSGCQSCQQWKCRRIGHTKLRFHQVCWLIGHNCTRRVAVLRTRSNSNFTFRNVADKKTDWIARLCGMKEVTFVPLCTKYNRVCACVTGRTVERRDWNVACVVSVQRSVDTGWCRCPAVGPSRRQIRRTETAASFRQSRQCYVPDVDR